MKTKSILFIAVFAISMMLSGCLIKSLHPFYSEEDVVFKPELIGSWLDSDSASWEFEQYSFSHGFMQGDSLDNSYKVHFVEGDSIVSIFNVHLFMLNDEYYMDFYPMMSELFEDEFYSMHLLPTHSLAKVELKGNTTMKIMWFNEDWLNSLFEENRVKIAHEVIKIDEHEFGTVYALTAQTDELQKFIVKYGDDPEAIDTDDDGGLNVLLKKTNDR